MTTLNSNTVYLSINGTNVSAYFTDELTREVGVNLVDVTAGSGQEWEMLAPGLSKYSMKLMMVYDIETYDTVVRPAINAIRTGVVTVMFCPEGEVPGKPKDELKALVEKIAGPSKTIGKDKVAIELAIRGAATPVALIESGGKF